jgi:hypothetical protein
MMQDREKPAFERPLLRIELPDIEVNAYKGVLGRILRQTSAPQETVREPDSAGFISFVKLGERILIAFRGITCELFVGEFAHSGVLKYP